MQRLGISAAVAGLLSIATCSSACAAAGYVVGDEPTAVRVGASVLTQGGSAADAAAAVYFTLAVTYPVAAGLGGGGVCVVHDPARGDETIDFQARDAAAGGIYAVPGAVRGMEALQGTYGRLPWQRAVGQAEGLAATGFPISGALAARLKQNQYIISHDHDLLEEFVGDGHFKSAGATAANVELGETLSAIRERGAGGFYRGDVAQMIADDSTKQGGAITPGELGSYAVKREAAALLVIGNDKVRAPRSAGFAGKLLSRLVGSDGQPVAQDHLAAAAAAATKAALDQSGIASVPQDLGATGFAVVDGSGQAVACAVTMNGPFGSGHTAPGTGVTLANAPAKAKAGISPAFLTPMIATGNDGAVVFAGAGSGGPNGTASIVYALLRQGSGADLTRSGMIRTTGLAPYSTINAIVCTGEICAAIPDPAASGLGLAVGQ